MATRASTKQKSATKPRIISNGSRSKTAKSPRLQPAKKITLRPASEWVIQGIEISRIRAELPPEEQETAISFLKGGRYAEITTADRQWQKRIESLGVKPRAITTFDMGKVEIRYYDRVPKGYVQMPSV